MLYFFTDSLLDLIAITIYHRLNVYIYVATHLHTAQPASYMCMQVPLPLWMYRTVCDVYSSKTEFLADIPVWQEAFHKNQKSLCTLP